jgi:hypothetical protein
MTEKRITVPPDFDPHDMTLKRQIHELADEKNLIHIKNGSPILVCGANRKVKGPCLLGAGFGTLHLGYGRCKYHGGCNTGPKTPEGKANIGRASKHGLYSKVLSEVEREIYEELLETSKIDLTHEIRLLQTKIISYLQQWRKRYEYAEATFGVHEAEKRMRVWYTTGENGTCGYYHAGSIEDKPLIKALNELAKMVEKNARLDPDGTNDLLSMVNGELQAASAGKINIAWGQRPAQHRSEGGS